MSTSVELSAGLLKRFMEFTRRLTPEQLEALVDGGLKFGILTPPQPAVTAPPAFDADKITVELGAALSREGAREYLDRLKIKLPDYKRLAKALDTPIVGATTRDAIRDRIVEHMVGVRLNSQTIRHGAWSSQ